MWYLHILRRVCLDINIWAPRLTQSKLLQKYNMSIFRECYLGKGNPRLSSSKGIRLCQRKHTLERLSHYCTPMTLKNKKGDFQYAFDAIYRNSEKAVFVKVFPDPLENCKEDELVKIRKAVEMTNMYYDCHIFIFTKRRFSDYAAREAVYEKVVSFVEVDRLKY